ncbi:MULTISPECIES: aromatic acid exporter family protein [Hungatella]|uniref:Putative aromatic acid exporter C-terminal domain-containing protein n=1 Tax=Hungatella hathewayi TaxID=154046 RepID=A0AAW9WI78_9FIRM|nr:aromatic acid exporter family protein [Hungatella hathewayi]MCQ4828291.1 aromatic acid exporter family protein [Hungatella sp. SL.1.14]MUB63092.1 hypothetical protein [Hungatella hathewayi]CCZ62290.1 membrane spanning protein [Hungatella hathewayi CAG:224]CUP38515.1 membrane protein [Hungatella hathewayi]
MKKPDYGKVMKIAAGAGLAMILAERLGLNYSASAGVITLLSIQDTKKETIRVVVRRLLSFVLAMVISAACFSAFGYGPAAVSVFLLMFSTVCMAFGMQEGISVNTVLMTHFLAERSMNAVNIGNELGLLVTGAGIGVLLNLYIPGKERVIRMSQRQIEGRMKEILWNMAKQLTAADQERSNMPSDQPPLTSRLTELDETLKQGEKSAYEDMENKLLSDTRYYLRYMNMRRTQAFVLGRIEAEMSHLKELPSQARPIAELMERISVSFHEYNNAVELLASLDRVTCSMREQPLPESREEFESRAVLFQILLELEQFLEIKKKFVEELSAEEIGKFWKENAC